LKNSAIHVSNARSIVVRKSNLCAKRVQCSGRNTRATFWPLISVANRPKQLECSGRNIRARWIGAWCEALLQLGVAAHALCSDWNTCSLFRLEQHRSKCSGWNNFPHCSLHNVPVGTYLHNVPVGTFMLSVPVGTLDDFSELSPLGKLAQSADAYHFKEHILAGTPLHAAF
jgi:hypothetical protein